MKLFAPFLFTIISDSTLAISMMKLAGIQDEEAGTPYYRFPDDGDDGAALGYSWQQDVFPFVMFNYRSFMKSQTLERVFSAEMGGKSFKEETKSLKPQYDAISYLRYTNCTEEYQAVLHRFLIGVATDKRYQQGMGVRHIVSSFGDDSSVKRINDGVAARVLAGKAFGVSGSSLASSNSRYSQSVSIVDFEMVSYSRITFQVPQGFDIAFLYVYGEGYIRRLNRGDRNWVMAHTAVVFDASESHHRGIDLEAGRLGCHVLFLAAKKESHLWQQQQQQQQQQQDHGDDDDYMTTHSFSLDDVDNNTEEIKVACGGADCSKSVEPSKEAGVQEA